MLLVLLMAPTIMLTALRVRNVSLSVGELIADFLDARIGPLMLVAEFAVAGVFPAHSEGSYTLVHA